MSQLLFDMQPGNRQTYVIARLCAIEAEMASRSYIVWLSVLLFTGFAQPIASADDAAIPPARKEHWAWKPPVRPPLPAIKNAAWVRNPIDAFILAKLEATGLTPAPPASREQLLRRMTLDLIGLPPTPTEIDAFLADTSPHAWKRVIDRLLASPHYGERWGRHWLDLARYADSNGYEFDEPRPDAWRYRDYVIASFNTDKPYDRFVAEQLAGDELFPEQADALIATGFNVLGPDMTDASDQAKRRQDTLNDMTDTAGLVFLGLTLGCARCHDHKFEPIPQSDYYRLQAFFAPASFRRDLPIASAGQRVSHEAAARQYTALVKPIRDALADLETPYRRRLYEKRLAALADEARAAHQTPAEKRTAAQKALVEKTDRLLVVAPQAIVEAMTPEDRRRQRDLQEQLRKFDDRKPTPLPVAMGLHDAVGEPAKTFVLERGEFGRRGDEVAPGYPSVVSPKQQPRSVGASATGRRAVLARWIASPDNPLAARVMVNRLWHYHFGRGLVGTPSDFGVRGERPTHPELLDWLACEFIASGRSIKHMHRLIVTSAVYQQASSIADCGLRIADSKSANPQSTIRNPQSIDADNRLLSHFPLRRLDAESIRDSLLAVSDRLDQRMGGHGTTGGFRRSVYLFSRRNLRDPFLATFDLPDSTLSCPKRERSTTAPQALTLLNADEVMAAARALAALLEREPGQDARIDLAYRRVLGRRPTAEECEAARDFLVRSPLTEFCRALFNVSEFLYLD
jgi:hypothetical protein